jgi:hypothetical protein
VKSEPAWNLLPDDVPPRIRTLLERCLRKDPAGRLRDAGDVKVELDARDEGTPAIAQRPDALRSRRRSLAPLAVGGALTAAALVTYAVWNSSVAAPAEVVPVPVFMEPATPGGNFAVSASGTLAYAPGDATYFQRRLVTIGGCAAEPVIDEQRYFDYPRASPDGRRAAVMVRSARDRVWMIDTARGTLSRVTTANWQQEGYPVFSHDGRWLALATVEGSTRSGRGEVWVAAFPSMTNAAQVSISGGSYPRWGGGGKRLHFYRANGVWSVEVGGGPAPAISKPLLVTELPTVRPRGFFDMMPDGRILFVEGRDVGATPELRVILNWSAELRRLLPAP